MCCVHKWYTFSFIQRSKYIAPLGISYSEHMLDDRTNFFCMFVSSILPFCSSSWQSLYLLKMRCKRVKTAKTNKGKMPILQRTIQDTIQDRPSCSEDLEQLNGTFNRCGGGDDFRKGNYLTLHLLIHKSIELKLSSMLF